MNKDKQLRNLKIIFLILLLVIGLVSLFEYKKNTIVARFELNKIGMTIGKWEGADTHSGTRNTRWVEQGDLIMRTYHQEEDLLYLVAIQERGDRHRVHSPADCYTGAGWVVLGKESVRIGEDKKRPVRRMRVVKDDTSRLVYYWFTNGVDRCASFRNHLLLFLRDVLLKGSIRSWVCFQVSADTYGSIEETDAMVSTFISDMEYSMNGI